MLSPELIKKIKKVHIRSSRLVNSMMAGHYKSIFRGSGIEFEEVREYIPGDEVKSIDWKVSARMGRPYIKLYKEERELIIMLLIDMSASENFGTIDKTKQELSAEIASILAFNAIRNNDKVGAILFTDRVEKYIPPKKGSSHVWRLIKEIFDFKPQHTKTDIENAVSYLGKISRKKTVSFIISDFLSENYIYQFKIASKKHKLFAILLSDPGEFYLPDGGFIFIENFETGECIKIDAFDKNALHLFEKEKRQEYNKIIETFKKSKIDCKPISTNDSVADELTKYFMYLEKKIR